MYNQTKVIAIKSNNSLVLDHILVNYGMGSPQKSIVIDVEMLNEL